MTSGFPERILERVDLADYPLSAANVLYVAKTGSDENPGTKEAPLASLAAALAKMKNKKGGVIYLWNPSPELRYDLLNHCR